MKEKIETTSFLSPSLQIFLDLPRVRGRVRLELEVHEREGLDSRRLGRSHEALWLRHELHLIIHVLVASPHNACSLSDAKERRRNTRLVRLITVVTEYGTSYFLRFR